MKTAKRFGLQGSRKIPSAFGMQRWGILREFSDRRSDGNFFLSDFAQTYLIFCVSLPLRKKLYGKMKTAKRFGLQGSRKIPSAFGLCHFLRSGPSEKFFLSDFAQTYLIFCVWLPLRQKLYGKMKTAKRFGLQGNLKIPSAFFVHFPMCDFVIFWGQVRQEIFFWQILLRHISFFASHCH